MDDEGSLLTLNDPAMVLLGLAALIGLVAGAFWLKLARSIDLDGPTIKAPDPGSFFMAFACTGLALLTASAGFLLGRFTGRF